MNLPIGVTRSRALRLLRRLGFSCMENLRNYEIEERLRRHLGHRWVVAEWCPFDGSTCDFRGFASVAELKDRAAAEMAHFRSRGMGESWRISLIALSLEVSPRGPRRLDRRLLEMAEGRAA
jgi:hypothetical protein